MNKWVLRTFFALVLVSLLTPFWVFKELMFPYITSKAFFFRILVLLALPCYVYLVAFEKKLRPNLKNKLNLAVLIFLVINLLAAIFGVSFERSLLGNFERMGGVVYLAYLSLVFFYIQLLGQAGGNYLKRFLQSFIAVAVLVTLNGLSGWIGGPTLVLDPSLPARVSSTFGNPIFFPSYLILPMFLSAFLALQESKKNLKITYWVLAGLQLLGIYSSGTRGAMVGLIVGGVISGIAYVILTKNTKVKRTGIITLAVVVLLLAGLFAFKEKLPQGSTLARIVNLRDSNTEARLIQWKSALQGFTDKPVLGVGPENYYVVFNQYYNPEMYKYDASWFDKPHNYVLEVLVTTGGMGLLLYVLMFVFSVFALWRAYKSELLSLGEACLLLAGVIVYQVQNLFVFDTVSASTAFFVFTGFLAFLWHESKSEENSSFVLSRKVSSVGIGVLVLSVLVMIYLQYASNISPIQAAKRVNMGMAYSSYDPYKAAGFFETAFATPFNLDSRETANRFSDFAGSLANSQLTTKDIEFVKNQINLALEKQKAITEKVENDPILWMRLASLQMNKAFVFKEDLKSADPYIEKAVSLAPNRAELLRLKIQYYGYAGDWANAVKVAQRVVELNPYNAEVKWQLAMAHFLNKNIDEAIKAGDAALAQGYVPNQIQQFAWYIQYYQEKRNFVKTIPLLKLAMEVAPNELTFYFELAKAYAETGDFGKAKALAEQIAALDPNQKQVMDEFIRTLK